MTLLSEAALLGNGLDRLRFYRLSVTIWHRRDSVVTRGVYTRRLYRQSLVSNMVGLAFRLAQRRDRLLRAVKGTGDLLVKKTVWEDRVVGV